MNVPPAQKQCPVCFQATDINMPACPSCGHQFVTNFVNPHAHTQLISPAIDPQYLKEANSKKVAAGICGILFGGLGIHKFILGYTAAGIITICITVIGGILTCGIASGIMGLITFIEGIMYLTKSDADFHQTYIQMRKEWF